jgi:hypothetical protein
MIENNIFAAAIAFWSDFICSLASEDSGYFQNSNRMLE